LGFGWASLDSCPRAFAEDSALSVTIESAGTSRELKGWDLEALGKLPQRTKREKGVDGQLSRWRGPLLSTVIDDAMSSLTAEQRATVDLVVLKNSQGEKAMVPRSFVQRLSPVLALSRNGRALGPQGPIYSVPPWTTEASSVEKEDLPVRTFFVAGVSEIVLTNYHARFSAYFLKRKTDPLAMRGEKIFVQSCTGCHAVGHGPGLADLVAPAFIQKSRGLASGRHPTIQGVPPMSSRDHRALGSYFDAQRSQAESAKANAS
jgi:hypothetical protein